ncbi:MAG: hypothetical protein IPP94_09425 [Ignavibacteria bacterium]|nr:hypothetical protein [Ignavibacteria bacterium]
MKIAVPAAVIVIIAALFLLPIELPVSVDAVGLTAPAREFQIVREASGRIVVTLYNHEKGGTESFLVHQFEREDAVQVELAPGPVERGGASAGDTLALIRSANLAQQTALLEGGLAEARASLDMSLSGEKKEIIEEARKELAQRNAEYDGREKARARIQTLVDRGVAAQQELDDAARLAEAARQAVAAADARVRALTAGEKDSRVAFARAQVASLEGQLRALEQKRSFFALRAPFAGRMYRSAFSDTLVRLGDTSHYVVAMMLPWSSEKRFGVGSPVAISIPGVRGGITGRITQKNTTVCTRQGTPVFVAVATFDEHPVDLPPGLPASCSITCGSVSLRAYLRDVFLRVFRLS